MSISSSSRTDESKKILYSIYRQDWAELEKLIKSIDTSSLQEYGLFRSPSCKTHYNILHLVCKHQAPTSVISALVEKNYDLLLEKDYRMRLPLHIAIQNGASIGCISYMVEKYPESVMEKELMGCIPLHLVVKNQDGIFRSSKRTLYDRSLIRVLLDANPRSVLEEDGRGMNAIEHALTSEMDQKIVRLLQHASRKAHEANNKMLKEKVIGQNQETMIFSPSTSTTSPEREEISRSSQSSSAA